MAAELDAVLEQALKEFLADDEKVLKEVFGEYGPLGALGAKNKLALLVHLYTKNVYTEVERISKIRNRFAHRQDVDRFDHPEIAGQIDNLSLTAEFLVLIQPQIARFPGVLRASAAEGRGFKFVLSVGMCVSAIKTSLDFRKEFLAEHSAAQWRAPPWPPASPGKSEPRPPRETQGSG